MILKGILMLLLWQFLIPAAAGAFFADLYKGKAKILFMWVSGQAFLWAIFETAGVPFILKRASFRELAQAYTILAVMAALLAVLFLFFRQRKEKGHLRFALVGRSDDKKGISAEMVFGGIFVALLFLQVVLAIFMTYSDGDDAFYVAEASITLDSGQMYVKNPYTVGEMDHLQLRYALAPFSVWMAFLAKVSGLKTVTIAHVAVSAVSIWMANIVYFLIGGRLFKGGKKYVFIVFAQLFILFGDYSVYTAERFLIFRSRQGKAALSSIVIPMLFLVFLLVMEYLKNEKKIPARLWILLILVKLSGNLCSSQSILISSLLVVLWGFSCAVAYRRWKMMVPVAASCIPDLFLALTALLG